MPTITKYSFFVMLLAMIVIVLGSYTRLSDAGLGCPDWPGCYGHIDVPELHHEIKKANEAYPDRPVEAAKAWKEMIHRYFASSLGLFIFALLIWAWKKRAEHEQIINVPIVLAALVVFQGLLGMWTVTLKVMPVIVMAHLLGGFATLSLLWWFTLRQSNLFSKKAIAVIDKLPKLRLLALLAMIVVILQIALGGWTSSHYAALACPDFPTCQTYWWPPMNFSEGFTLWHGLDIDYEFGILDNDARVAIHMTHRLGAVFTFLFVGYAVSKVLAAKLSKSVNRSAIAVLVLLLVQVGLGISNIVFQLPLMVAVMHNLVGALLLLSLINLNHVIRPR